ncbi:hypothetical protein [uncultured Bacteroides sp.]|uniref:hypothetical protein n=1 Tax=uncultured Bacteroides sp. TaxID=162156 RepID=UPI002AAA9314|nr:hypothetical protein [uncultured Bacteroides sp.]
MSVHACQDSRSFSIWKFIIAVVVGFGVIAQFGALYPRTYSLNDLATLSYLTIFFNIFIALYFLIAALWLLAHGEKDDRGREWCVGLKHALLVSVLFVGIASSGLLANIPFIHPIAIEHASTVLTLYSPLMITLDWLVFEKKGQMNVLSPVHGCSCRRSILC